MKKILVIFMTCLAMASCTSKGGQQGAAASHADSVAADTVITDSINYVRQSIIDAMAATYPEFELIGMSIKQDSSVFKGGIVFTFLRNDQVIYTEQEFETDERGIIKKLRKTKYALYKDVKDVKK